jgi:hypothetical protein
MPLPPSVTPAVRRLARRLALGLLLEVWPRWILASLLGAGIVALVCRLFIPAAASNLPWLWLAPVLASLPAVIVCVRRRYRHADVVALADSLGGGQGLLLSRLERPGTAWDGTPLMSRASTIDLPRLRPWRRLLPLLPAFAFLAVALLLPQRWPADDALLAEEIAADLTATLGDLKEQGLITPDDEQRLEEEIERIRTSARERVDAASWEAADALRERLSARLSEQQDALQWAAASLARYAAAAQSAAASSDGAATPEALASELADALGRLAQSGLLDDAPADLRALARSGRLPADADALRRLTGSLAEYLAERGRRTGDLAGLAPGFGRFDPAEFGLDGNGTPADGDGIPGRGGVNRGRGDAQLTWGEETTPFDRFKAQPLPPGAPRSPDDWAPVVELPGAPAESARPGTPSQTRTYAADAGQSAWRRTLAPRHQSAVKKYFEK